MHFNRKSIELRTAGVLHLFAQAALFYLMF